MCGIDWVALSQIVAAFGTLALGALAIWGDYLKARLLRPSLRLEMHNGFKGVVTKINQSNVIFYHLKLVNLKKFISVKNCKVILKEVRKETNSGAIQNSLVVESCFYFSPALIVGFLTDIDSNEKVVDFLSVEEGKNFLSPKINFLQYSLDLNVYANERTIFALEIVGTYYKSKRQYFEVNYTGGWDKNLNTMTTYVKIREIKAEDIK